MAFRKKAEFILTQKPDILFVPEFEHPDRLKFPCNVATPTLFYWFGENKNKGLCFFLFCNYRFVLLDNYNADFKNIFPLKVFNCDHHLSLFAIWANNQKDNVGAYITQVWKAIHNYGNLPSSDKRKILIGDFNSIIIWEKTLEGRKSLDSC